MKCPKSKEFFSFTPRSIHCEHNFDSEMHTADIVGVWRIIFVIRLVLNYVMLSKAYKLHLLHMVSTHHFHTTSIFHGKNSPHGDGPRPIRI